MAEPTVVRVNSPVDLLGVVPHRVGFHPVESAVLICLTGERRRDGLVLRVDLDQEPMVLADMLTRHALRVPEITGVVLVLYTEKIEPPMAWVLYSLVRESMLANEIDMVESLLVHDGRWLSFQCTDENCCPAQGKPLPEELSEAAARYAAESIGQGGAVLPSREALEASIRPTRSEEDRAQYDALFEQVSAEIIALMVFDAGGKTKMIRETKMRLRSLVVATIEHPRGSLPPDDMAFVVQATHSKHLRDRAMGVLFDFPENEEAVLLTLTRLAEFADDEDCVPICLMLGITAYAVGQGGFANVALRRALERNPLESLALMLLTALAETIPPEAIREQMAEAVRAMEAEDG